jgi:hypothetical protein
MRRMGADFIKISIPVLEVSDLILSLNQWSHPSFGIWILTFDILAAPERDDRL